MSLSRPGSEADEAATDPLVRHVRLRGARHARWLREDAPALARHLGKIGVLGWLIVGPTLFGMFAGPWIDRRLGTGLTFAAALLVLGLAVGSWSAWKWVHAEMRR